MADKRTAARFGGLLWGGVLLVVGGWLLLEQLDLELFGAEALWPVFPLVFGAALLVTFFVGERDDPGLVWPGTLGVLLGLFFFAFSLGVVEWDQMGVLWPVFPLIVGLAFLATWLAGGSRRSDLLAPAAITLLVGVVGLALTLRLLDWRMVEILWPLVLIAIGAAMIATGLGRRRS